MVSPKGYTGTELLISKTTPKYNSLSKHNEWTYNVLDLDSNKAIGIQLPLNGDGGRLFSLSYTTEDQAISNLKNLLLTRKGERIMQPNFGSAIYDLLFEQNTSDIIGKLSDSLNYDIGFWLPYIVLNNIDIQPKLDGELGSFGHGIQIVIKFKVTEQGANQEITFVVLETGQAAII
jgi:phage baseplate assembly protein W